MKKILLTAIVAMLGMSAFAAQPDAGTKGYFYNPAAKMFIDTNAKLSATEGELFEVKYKSDTEKAADPAADYPGRGFDGGYYIRFKSSKGDLGMESNPLKNGSGYAQFIVIEKDGKWLISHPYPNTGGNVPGWVNDNLEAYQAAYLQVVDGALVFAQGTENEGAYWQFIDEDTYKELTAGTPEPTPKAFPETGAKGYIYNPGINMFIDATGALATEGAIFAVYRKDSDTASDIRFGVPGDEANKHLRINGDNPVLQTTDPYYSKWGFEAAEGGLFLLKAGYDYGDPKWCTKGYYLTATQDGAFEFVETATEASYWQFLTEEEIATRIASVSVKTVQKGIYNVAGQQIKALQKGLNIVNGKKIMVK